MTNGLASAAAEAKTAVRSLVCIRIACMLITACTRQYSIDGHACLNQWAADAAKLR